MFILSPMVLLILLRQQVGCSHTSYEPNKKRKKISLLFYTYTLPENSRALSTAHALFVFLAAQSSTSLLVGLSEETESKINHGCTKPFYSGKYKVVLGDIIFSCNQMVYQSPFTWLSD